jgi:2-polyprenyl-6-methoxyphenol hydroxylase-like FAD-dependent oxidoreductase
VSRIHDVVIVGGRVAGAATALLLARAGFDVTVIERAAHGSDTLSTHALLRGGVLQLARWGVLPHVVDTGTPAVRRTTFHYPDIDPVSVTLRAGSGVEALYAPRRHVLDRILIDAAARQGADVLHGRTVTEILTAQGRVTGVRVTGDPTSGTGASAGTPLLARWVIGADGIASTVARSVAAPTRKTGRAGSSVLYRYVDECPVDEYVWAYGDRAAAGMIPTNDGQACVFVSTTPQRMRMAARAGRDTAFDMLLEHASYTLRDLVRGAGAQGPLRGWAGRPGFLRRAWGPGWALVGDAGYFKDPISAHGMTDALRDAELLARAVASAGSGVEESSAFAEFERRRDALSIPYFSTIDAIASYDWTPATVRGLLREASSAMSDEVEAIEAFDVLPGHGDSAGHRELARSHHG